MPFHCRDEAGLLGTRRSLERLEGNVGVESAIARLRGFAFARKVERAIEQRQNHRRRRVAHYRRRITSGWNFHWLAAQRVDVVDDVPALLRREHPGHAGHGRPANSH